MPNRAALEEDVMRLVAAKRYDEGLAALIALYGAELRGYLWGTFGDSTEGDDVFQDLSLALWQALSRYQGASSLRTFCYAIAHHLISKRLSRRSRRMGERLDTARQAALAANSMTSGNAHALRDQLVELARQQLEPDEREVLILRTERDLSHAAIAQILNLSESAARKRYERAKQRLKDLIDLIQIPT